MAEAKQHNPGNPQHQNLGNTVREFSKKDQQRDSLESSELNEKLPEFVKHTQEKVADTVERVASVASDKASQAGEWLTKQKDMVMENSDAVLTASRDYVRRYPMRTLVAGIACGAIVGWLVSGRRRYDA